MVLCQLSIAPSEDIGNNKKNIVARSVARLLRAASPKESSVNPIPEDVNDLSRIVVDAAMAVHRELGPGLLEQIYECCLVEELRQRAVPCECQVMVPVTYKGRILDTNLRMDLLVDGKLVVELKSVDSLAPIHHAQLLTYLKQTGCRLGLLINFNVPLLKSGIRRIAN